MISSFVSPYSFRILFIKTNSSWLTFEPIEALEIKTSIQFNLDFANNTILSCWFFFLIIDLYFLIPAPIAQNFNDDGDDDDDEDNGDFFVVWVINEKHLALFPAGAIVRDPHHRESPTRHRQDLNLCRIWVQTLLNEVVTTTTPPNPIAELLIPNRNTKQISKAEI